MIIVLTSVLITGTLSFISIQKARARNIINDPTLQFSPTIQPNPKPCKNCTSFQVVQRSGSAIQIPPESDKTATALCQSGEVATGGGYTEDGPMLVFESKALPDNTGWSITFHNGGFGQPTLSGSAYAECATLVP
jgi:hypothetical protein